MKGKSRPGREVRKPKKDRNIPPKVGIPAKDKKD